MLKRYDYQRIPITEILNDILYDSARRGASDIHFDPLSKEMKVRIRIDGSLIDYASVPIAVHKNLVTNETSTRWIDQNNHSRFTIRFTCFCPSNQRR